MKKLVIFIILFIVSIPAFAQDKSLFTENFSLIKYSEANNRKVFEIGIFSERTDLLRVNAFENRKQNWWDKSNIRYGPQQYLSSEEESESLAEFYLKRFAERNKKRRKVGGTIAIVVGGGLMVLGASIFSGEEEDWYEIRPWIGTLSIIMGVGCVVGGAFTLAVPSRAERKLDDVLFISDHAQRERASHVALSLFAARGRRIRILTGILAAATSALSFSTAEESVGYAYAASCAALAVYSFVVKSSAERTYQNYLREKEYRKELALRVGIMPYGGVKISLALAF